MEYIIIALLTILIIISIIILIKIVKNNKSDLVVTEKLGSFETNLTKELGDFKYDFSII